MSHFQQFEVWTQMSLDIEGSGLDLRISTSYLSDRGQVTPHEG